jgi:hypothetical protein
MVVFLALACLAGQAPDLAEGRFGRLDRDGDGFITVNEAPRVAVTRSVAGAPSPGGAAWVRTYDRDDDGRVSAAEYAAGPRATLLR